MIATLEPVWSEVVQSGVYRALLLAQGYPGEIQELAAWTGLTVLPPASLAVLATLLDGSVTWADPDGLVSEAEGRLLEARPAPENEADYILADGGRAPRSGFQPRLGNLLNPEQAATLILRGGALGAADGGVELELNGPGVPGEKRLRLAGFERGWFERQAEWNRDFPLGVDLILTDLTRLAALPRTTQVRVRG